MILALLLGCADKGGDSADAWCAEAPTVTWESHGQAIVTQWCEPCHASTSNDRHGAPESVTFDTKAEVLGWKDRILAVATSADPTMPPSLDLPEDDRYRLEVFLRCAD